jgi:hypothetical protein
MVPAEKSPSQTERLRERYLDLVAACVTGSIQSQQFSQLQFPRGSWRAMLLAPIAAALRTKEFCLLRKHQPIAPGSGDRPESALTMIGSGGIANIRRCLESAIRENIPGDFIEAGV